MVKNIFFFLIFFFIIHETNASQKDNVINKLLSTNSLVFDFNQKIDGNINEGSCQLLYPKKIFCEYNDKYRKIIVSNGKELIVKNKSINQIYKYDLEKTPFKIILDKNFLLEKIKFSQIFDLENNKTTFYIKENNLDFKIFFDSNNYSILGWETIDVYQNTVRFEIFNLKLNTAISKKKFNIN